MKEYESPKAEYLHLDDVITASGAEPCKCYATPHMVDPNYEMCKINGIDSAFETQTGT